MTSRVLLRTILIAMTLTASVALQSKVASIGQPKTINLADIQQGLGNAEVKQITGTGSNFSMRITLENKNSYPVEVVCHEGSVIQSETHQSAEMITLYPQSFLIPPGEVEEFGIETYCIEAWKKPSQPHSADKHMIQESSENKNLNHLISTIHQIENNISRKIISIEGDGFTAEPMAESMVPLAQSSQYFKSQNGDFKVKLNEQIVQFAIWQVTDKVNMDHLSRILNVNSEDTKEALKMIAQLSNVILEEAELEPAIQF